HRQLRPQRGEEVSIPQNNFVAVGEGRLGAVAGAGRLYGAGAGEIARDGAGTDESAAGHGASGARGPVRRHRKGGGGGRCPGASMARVRVRLPATARERMKARRGMVQAAPAAPTAATARAPARAG